MSKSQEIIEMIQGYHKGDSQNEPHDINHWLRRFFRCWLDGSYKGETHYKQNLAYIKQYKDNEKKMRSFVIGQFTPFLATEFNCSYSTVHKAVIRSLSSKDLETLNKELISDCLTLLD